jgi:PII-like signaling protein
MKTPHRIETSEMGKIRIYLTPRERVKTDGVWARLNARPVYQEIIRAAKEEGLHNAVAFTSHYGYSGGGAIAAKAPEATNAQLTLCVELIDHKDRLEAFCRRHGALLKGKPIVYKHVEHWTMHADHLVEEDASPDEVVDGAERKPLK